MVWGQGQSPAGNMLDQRLRHILSLSKDQTNDPMDMQQSTESMSMNRQTWLSDLSWCQLDLPHMLAS